MSWITPILLVGAAFLAGGLIALTAHLIKEVRILRKEP